MSTNGAEIGSKILKMLIFVSNYCPWHMEKIFLIYIMLYWSAFYISILNSEWIDSLNVAIIIIIGITCSITPTNITFESIWLMHLLKYLQFFFCRPNCLLKNFWQHAINNLFLSAYGWIISFCCCLYLFLWLSVNCIGNKKIDQLWIYSIVKLVH